MAGKKVQKLAKMKHEKEEARTRAQRAGTIPDISITLTIFKECVCKFYFSTISATLRLSHLQISA
jgi:hypothetical protein